MLKLQTDKLTELEKKIHAILSEEVITNGKLKIIEAADLCDVSPSKVSKLVKKLGFENFKQYKLYFSGQPSHAEVNKHSNEMERLIKFLESYDPKTVDDFLSVFMKFNKVIIFGLGPSYISADYFAYKLATVSDKNIVVTQHEDYAVRLADEDTLLIVFSVTGTFSSFKTLFSSIKNKGSEVMLILEESINTRDFEADYIFHLSKFNQNDNLLAFEKTRTIFFIFIEEIIAKLKQNLDETDG